MKKKINLLLYGLTLIAIPYLLYSNIGEINKILISLNSWHICVLISISILCIILNSKAFDISISILGLNLNVLEWFTISNINNLYNYIIPFNGGQAVRARYLKSEYNFSYNSYISFISNLYLINLLISSMIALGIAAYLYFTTDKIEPYLILFLVGVTVALLTTLLAIRFNFINKFEKLRKWKFLNKLMSNSTELLTSKQTFSLVGIYLARLSFMCLRLFLLLGFLNFNVNFFDVFLVLCVAQFSTVLSITPGNIGVREVIISSLGIVIGLNFEEVLYITFIERGIILLLTLLLGLISLWYITKIKKKLIF